MTKVIKLWFNPDYNLYFPKSAKDCKALMDAGWTNLPIFTPPGVLRPGLNSIEQLYGYLTMCSNGTTFNLQLGNYLATHLTMMQNKSLTAPTTQGGTTDEQSPRASTRQSRPTTAYSPKTVRVYAG